MSRDLLHERGIRQSAGRLRLVVIAAMVVVALSVLLVWSGVQLGFARVEMRGHGDKAIDPRVAGTITMVLAEIAMFRLVQMLGALAAGEAFSAPVIGHFRGFAFWLMLMALADLLAPALLAIARPGPTRAIEIPIDFSATIMVGVTVLLFLLSRLLERARAIDEENREIV